MRALMQQGMGDLFLLPDEFQVLPKFVALKQSGAAPDEMVTFLESTAFSTHMKDKGLWPEPAALLAAMSQKSPPQQAFQDFIALIAQKAGQAGPRIWGDKTPETVFTLDQILALWPEAKVLHVVRDPLATVASMHKAWGRSFVRGAVIWRDAQRAAARYAARVPEQYHRVAFEDLMADPEQELGRIARWLETSFDTAAIAEVRSEERWGKAAGQVGLQTNRAKGTSHLSAQQITLIEQVCFDEMQAAGYSPTRAQAAWAPGALRLKAASLWDAAKVLRAYGRERGYIAALRYKLSQWRNR